MAADWNKPTVTSDYLSFVSEINGKFLDVVTLIGGMSNPPDSTFRFNRTSNWFEEWVASGTYWNQKVLSLGGGGTGANTAPGARTNLGIGSMGTQNSNAVNITGGSITGVQYSAADITSGVLALSRGGTGSSLAIGSSGTVLISNGSVVGFAAGNNIAELNASALNIGTVPAARLSGVALLGGSNVFTGTNIFNADPYLNSPIWVHGNFPTYHLYHLQAPVDLHYVRLASVNGGFYIQRINDAYNVAVNLFTVDSNGIITADGSGITNLNAANIALGIINPARLGSGPANASTYLRGDNSWQVVSSGGSPVDPAFLVPSGLIAIFDTNCPAGWTRFTSLDGRFPMGNTSFGGQGGASTHSHGIGLNTSASGPHSHGLGNVGGTFNVTTGNATNNAFPTSENNGTGSAMEHIDTRHTHQVSGGVSFSGNTDNSGDHSHQVSGQSADANSYPPYVSVVYCRKN